MPKRIMRIAQSGMAVCGRIDGVCFFVGEQPATWTVAKKYIRRCEWGELPCADYVDTDMQNAYFEG